MSIRVAKTTKVTIDNHAPALQIIENVLTRNNLDTILECSRENMGRAQFLREFCTITMNLGRQSGQTELAIKLANEGIQSEHLGELKANIVTAFKQSYMKELWRRLVSANGDIQYDDTFVYGQLRDDVTTRCLAKKIIDSGRALVVVDMPMQGTKQGRASVDELIRAIGLFDTNHSVKGVILLGY